MCSPDSCESKGMFNCYSVSTKVLWQQRAWFQIRYYQIKVAARRGGLDCIVIAKVAYVLWQQWTWGLDRIAIAKVIWQQGAGV